MSAIFDRLKKIIKSNFIDTVLSYDIDGVEFLEEDMKLKEEIEREWQKFKNNPTDFEPKIEEIQLTDAYRILEVSPDSTPDEIKSAYRDKVKKYHPDFVQNMGKEIRELAGKKIKEINLAFELIKKEKGF